MKDETVLETFDKDLRELTDIQITFLRPDAKFVYFRKGEAENNVPIMAAFIAVAAVVYNVIKDYPDFKKGVKSLITDIKAAAKVVLSYIGKSPQRYQIREIACPDDPEVTTTLEVLRKLGGDVRYLPQERRGKFRFFVNDTKYCLFVRKNDGRFSGVIGNDPTVISALKEAFESEWDDLTPLQDELIPQVPGITQAQQWDKE
jgi:hypothetical protein